jgi:uncharacterized protein (TIGR00299 family) protein
VSAAAYLDCVLGVAGDMLLGALVAAGADQATVTEAVASIGIEGVSVRFEPARRAGFACTRALVAVPDRPDVARTLADVLRVVDGSALTEPARGFARRVFERLAEAEAGVHGCGVDEIHFHEVGAHDALADVIGCAAAADSLGLLAEDAEVSCSAFAAGSGTVRSAHGPLPLPAPAVAELVRAAGAGFVHGDLAGERTTPTGAALALTLARPGPLPRMALAAVGYGGGGRDPADAPNLTRVLLGRAADPAAAGPRIETVTLLESTVDDLDPRLWPSVLEAVRAAGAWDCWSSPTVGRSGRPGVTVSAICDEACREAVAEALFRHAGTLGVRWSPWQRAVLPRRTVRVRVGEPGAEREVAVKLGLLGGRVVTAQPELADAQRVAAELGLPVRAVCERALAVYRRIEEEL